MVAPSRHLCLDSLAAAPIIGRMLLAPSVAILPVVYKRSRLTCVSDSRDWIYRQACQMVVVLVLKKPFPGMNSMEDGSSHMENIYGSLAEIEISTCKKNQFSIQPFHCPHVA